MIQLCCAFGGRSDEYEVSLQSAYAVLGSVDRNKYNLIRLGITRDGRWFHYTGPDEKIADGSWVDDSAHLCAAHLSQNYKDRTLYTDNGALAIDVFFPIMHGSFCEDGTLQGMLSLCGIPFVGSGCAASAVCMDKALTKQLIRLTGIPQADAVVARRAQVEKDPEAVCKTAEDRFPYPMFVKPARTGSSVGVSKAKDRAGLLAAIKSAARFDDKLLIEEYIPGHEFEVAVLGNDAPEASCVGEIVPGKEFYDYQNKYSDHTASYHVPARLPAETAELIRSYAVQVFRTLGCAGLARVDFFSDGQQVVFNEINTLPGFTPISMYPKLWIHDGLSYPELIDRLVTLALSAS